MRISIKLKVFAIINCALLIFAGIFVFSITFFSYDLFIAEYEREINEVYTDVRIHLNSSPDDMRVVRRAAEHKPVFITIADFQNKILLTTAPSRPFQYLSPPQKKGVEILKRSNKKSTIILEDIKEKQGEKLLFLIGKLPNDHMVIIERPLGSINEAIKMANKAISVTALIALVIGSIISYFFSLLLTRKIIQIRKGAHAITELNFEKQIEVNSNDELGDLANDINGISLKLKEAISELQRKNIVLNKDKKKLVKLNTELEKTSETDQLTQISNRLKIDKVLNELEEEVKVTNGQFSIILLDIDYFKKINDNYGHLIGDETLKSLASILKLSIRRSDEVGRWGGEEFIMILPNTNKENAARKAERLRKQIEEYNFTEVKNVTCSFGVSEFKQTDSIENLINRADERLYKSKENGRNRVTAN